MNNTRPSIVYLLAALTAFGPLSIDGYLPALPQIASDLGATASQAQATIGSFLAGLCLGMLCYGPLSDRFGRRYLLLGGVCLYLVATIACALAADAQQLSAMRFVQALGGSAAAVLARTMVRDLFPLDEAARILSLMHLVTMIATLVAPIGGSLILVYLGWRGIFYGLFILASICLLLSVFQLKESHPREVRSHSLASAFGAYWQMLKEPLAMAYIGCMGLALGGMFAFVTASSFVYTVHFSVSPTVYAVLMGSNIFGIVLATIINAKLVRRLGPRQMLGRGVAVVFLSSLGLLYCALADGVSLPTVVLCVMAYIGATGLFGANCIASLMHLYPKQAGAAAGLAISTQFALAAICSAVTARFEDFSPTPMCLIMVVVGMGSCACYGLINRLTRHGVPAHGA